jgi:hypothetical protein
LHIKDFRAGEKIYTSILQHLRADRGIAGSRTAWATWWDSVSSKKMIRSLIDVEDHARTCFIKMRPTGRVWSRDYVSASKQAAFTSCKFCLLSSSLNPFWNVFLSFSLLFFLHLSFAIFPIEMCKSAHL